MRSGEREGVKFGKAEEGDLVETEVGRVAESRENVWNDHDEVLGDGLMSSWSQPQQRRAVVEHPHQPRRRNVRRLCSHQHAVVIRPHRQRYMYIVLDAGYCNLLLMSIQVA